MAHEPETCPSCGATMPVGARFCPSCGYALSGEPVDYSSPPRLFGVVSPVAMLVLSCMLLLGAVVAFVLASPIAAIVLVALAGAVFVLFLGAAERDRESAVSRRALRARDAMRGWTRFTAGSVRAWTRASRDVWRLRGELGRLRRERESAQLALGDAAYREDDAAVAASRERMRELDAEIVAREEARSAALARARRRVEDERTAVHHTEVLPPDEAKRRHGQARG